MTPVRINMSRRETTASPSKSRPITIIPSFLTLAPELIQKIGDELGSSKKVLRLVCRHLNRAIESQVLSHVVLNFDTDTRFSCPDQLEMLAKAKDSAIPYYARGITFKSLSPPDKLPDPAPTHHESTDGSIWPRDARPPVSEIFESSRRKFHEYLGPALSKLTNIQTASWIIQRPHSKQAMNTVMDYLTSVSSLRNFHLKFACEFPLFSDLSRLSKLQRISIDGTNSDDFTGLAARSLSRAISASPKLTHLQLHSGLFRVDADSPTIRDLFSALPRDQTLRLTHLNLGGFRTQVSNEALRHLHCLRSLTLYDVLTEEPTGTGYSSYLPILPSPTSPATTLYGSDESETTNSGSPTETRDKTDHDDLQPRETGTEINFWTHLRQAEIHLESLTIDFMDDDVLDYLQSYSGLKHLALKRIASLNPGTVVSRFFSTILPKHKDTIESLVIMPLYEGKWCHNRAYDSILQQCLRLTELGWAVNAYLMPTNYEALDTLLDTAILIPSLTHLQIFAANDPQNAYAPIGIPSVLYLEKAAQLICDGIETFDASADFVRLAHITAAGQCFALHRNKKDGSWQYDRVEGEAVEESSALAGAGAGVSGSGLFQW
ncbi:hypothetical protein AX16_000286 [Volvariella volvacea WC 439]|nr:hypothetical protein AX16_000286 [Volvariella volvacea WC 439]